MTNSEFHTATMARVYAQQGHYQKAADIYRHILLKEPDRKEIVDALSMIEKQLADVESESKPDLQEKDLVHLFHEWFQMAIGHGRIERLKKLKQQFSTKGNL